ncbi:MAG: type II secretion system F family protein [Haloferacaceae archaeon]
MYPPVTLVPLLITLLFLLPVALAPVSERADLLVSRVAVAVFGDYVANRNSRRDAQVGRIRAARVETTHRVYAARTLLLAGVLGVAGGVFGVYLVAVVVEPLAVSAETVRSLVPPWLSFLTALTHVPTLDPTHLFVLLFLSSATFGAGSAFAAYWLRWQLLDQRARARATRIEATLPRTVGFVYALSRSGMPFPEVLGILTDNRRVYGAAADEIGVAVRDMEAFGTDVMSALQRMSDYTPSEGLDEFADNLASVLSSGRSLSTFLRDQHVRYREEARSQQEQFLELLATFAEIYVTVLVAGPLFLITVLVVIGLVLRNTLTLIRIVGYLGLPIATAAFLVYLDGMTQSLPGRRELDAGDAEGADEATGTGVGIEVHTAGEEGVADGGVATADVRDRDRANRDRLAAYDRFRRVRRWFDEPLETILSDARATFVVTVPIALLWVLARSVPIPLGPRAASVLDGPIVEAGVLVLTGYGLVYELRKRRARAIETMVPDFLDRLASLNEAGMTVVESLGRVHRGDLGPLGPEVERIRLDIEWGADASTALRRLDERTRTVAVSRAVTLITNAMEASGDLAPVLRIAAEEAQENRRLRRERRQEMLSYLLVIYISFLVFLGIVTALTVAFIPAINAASVGATGGLPGGAPTGGVGTLSSDLFGGLSGVNTGAYRTLFFHLAAIQGFCSGLVAGQLGEGNVRDGVKHAAIMLALAYVVFLFV